MCGYESFRLNDYLTQRDAGDHLVQRARDDFSLQIRPVKGQQRTHRPLTDGWKVQNSDLTSDHGHSHRQTRRDDRGLL